MTFDPHKTIFYSSNYYDGSNVMILTWSGNNVEDHTTPNCLELHQDADHSRIINIRQPISGIINNLLDLDVFYKVHIKLDISSESTDV